MNTLDYPHLADFRDLKNVVILSYAYPRPPGALSPLMYFLGCRFNLAILKAIWFTIGLLGTFLGLLTRIIVSDHATAPCVIIGKKHCLKAFELKHGTIWYEKIQQCTQNCFCKLFFIYRL